ncbi:hypothetical protein [Mangrovibacterium marinum]|uniref:hypothetical protein n=1 Tax=Mangrovibacterium marinum TaxID=1639118 RepID=UPI002A189863|nr:hypothetical protein [Mangrovibacterium marinum]
MITNSDNNRTAIGMSGRERTVHLKSADISTNCFSIEDIIQEKENNKISFSSTKFIAFLQREGVSKVKVGNEFELVLIQDYVVSKITTSEVKDLVLKRIVSLENDRITDYILNKTALFSMKYLDAVETVCLKMHRDTPEKSYFYFRNGVVKVTANGIEGPVPYRVFKRLIWKDHILERDYNPDTDIEKYPPVFENFITKLSNNEEERFMRICTVLGYCLYDYKTSANSRAVVINDENVSSNPEGGSGKSLLVSALSKFRKTVFYDGKTFDPKATFAWQKVDESVRLVCLDDVKRGFNFEELFSIITSGFRNINRKNRDEIELAIEDSPTIIITTNNILKGGSGSFARRQHQIEVNQYFHKNRTPLDEYTTPFFSGWDTLEWNRFDVFMLSCVQLFLKDGVAKSKEKDENQKQLIRCTNQSFAEWMEDNLDELTTPGGMGTTEMRDRYLYDTNQKGAAISDRKFTDYMKSFCDIYSYQYESIPNLRPRRFKLVATDKCD